jgi:creatinine amidohydrolase
MHLADLNWMDVEQYLQKDDRIILITGATEQHAYLSLLTDIRIPQAIASAVAEKEGVLVAPPLNFGCSAYFMEYPGTITLSPETFDRVVSEIVHSLIKYGFRRFFVMNGHGGNAMPTEFTDLTGDVEGLNILWYNWWQGEAAHRFAEEIGQETNHANWMENFPFTRVAEVPSGSKPSPTWDGDEPTRAALGDGSFGGAYQVPDETMQRFFDVLVAEAVEMLRRL